MNRATFAAVFITSTALAGCSGGTTRSDTGAIPDATTMETAALAASWGSNVSVRVDGDELVIDSDGLPDHGTLSAYATFGGDDVATVAANPTTISIPLVPTPSSAQTQTSLGAIGIAVSGAVFFNPYEGDGTTIALADNFTDAAGNPFIDDCNGHPIPNSGQYHYHGIPRCISDVIDTAGEHSRLVGYLLDGFPIYGPQDEGGAEPTDLDECLGHFGVTPEFADGVYHYHTTNRSPFISACYAGAVDAVMGGGMGAPR